VLQAGISFKTIFKWTIILIVMSQSLGVLAQNDAGYDIPDSTFLSTHSPLKATFMSAVVPGMGQIYNQKYWKVPIIYGGLTAFIYYAGYNNFVYKKYKEAYDIKLRGETELDKYVGYSKENLQQLKDNWRRYRDLCYIGIGVLYVAQIIDADVDAYLFDYDISQDLSFRIEPVVLTPETWVFANKNASPLGLRCTITF